MKRIPTIATALLFSFFASAQKIDFSGTWKLKVQESISGSLYSNGVPKQIKVTQTKDALIIESTTANTQGQDVTTIENLAFSGKIFATTTASKRKRTTSMTWNKDGKTFIRISDHSQTTDTSKVEIKYTETWSMEDGKLILLKKAENFSNGEEWEAEAKYEKQ